MPAFSKSSQKKLSTCHVDLQALFNEVIQIVDCTIIFGNRSIEEQFELYKQGRKLVSGVWVIENKGKIVTYLDGVNKKSRHNYLPSQAVDVAPYPIDWQNKQRFIEFGHFVLDRADKLWKEGKITHRVEWGGGWVSFPDLPHYQIEII